jgi:hypothetical protein
VNRRTFLGAAATTTSGAGSVLATGAGAASADDLDDLDDSVRDEAFLTLLTTRADALIPEVLDGYQDALVVISARQIARFLRRLAVAWSWRRSSHHHDTALLAPAGEMAAALAAFQHDDGLFDQGNLHSPPDTSFSVQDLCLVLTLLDADGDRRTAELRDTLAGIVRAAGPALAAGGVHTPNHRWELSAALARVHALFPDDRYPRRIEQWLAEGIDQYPGGQYSERSPTYAAVVTNPSLATLARLTGRPGLYAHIARNLALTLHQVEPNGEVVTVHSRRQDQTEQRSIAGYWLAYRELALRGEGDEELAGRFAAMAADIQRRIDELPPFEDPPGDALAHVMDHPELARPLPPSRPLPTRFTHHDADTRTVRVRRGDRSATLFGGTDLPTVHAIASGLSTNPTFLSFRNGAAILDAVRLSAQFFSLGHFRAQSLERVGDGAWRLNARVRAAYHLPLPPQHRRPDGDYPLTDDGRFWSAMDFPHRPKEYRTLRTEILVTESGTGFDIAFDVTESAVPLAVELAFREGGDLTGPGLEPVPGQPGTYQLVFGEAVYRVGDDEITVGPGNGKGPHQPPVVDPGERYTWLDGTLTPPGPRVLITGRSPFHHRLRCRGN